MDPDACLRRALHALCDGDREEAAHAFDALAAWLELGAVMPWQTQLQKMMMRDLLERMPP